MTGTATVATADVARGLNVAGLAKPTDAVATLTRFLNMLVRWNRVHNLTAIREPGELIERHLVESLALGPLLAGERIADIGTGAGLPGIPLAICYPRAHFTLIESRRKRVNFLRHVKAELGLENVDIAHCRAEDLPTAAPFATVLARAVAPPAELLAVTRKLTATGSILLLVTSQQLSTEVGALAADFVERPLGLSAPAKLRSTIVVLERVADPHVEEPR